jgi:3-hydroxyisobutyrate dehydrogenase-like beta-hydroxyacid dehydrogenase
VTVALLHPGAMGSRVSGELVAAGHEVRWLPAGRSPATAERAAAEGLTAADDLPDLLDGAAYVLAVLPPQAASDVARMVAAAGFTGTYVDANPVSPETLTAVRTAVEPAATLVDGGIVGPPPREGGRTHLYLSGPAGPAQEVAGLFDGTRVSPLVVGTEVGMASAAKQAYALFNKGRSVLALAAAALAEAYGVRAVLAGERERPGGDLLGELDALEHGLADSAWRWGPEMHEVAAALDAVGSGAEADLARALAGVLARFGDASRHG